jgi:competence ComEA-like helix-hairpin-helix protein
MAIRRSSRSALAFLALTAVLVGTTFATKKPPLHPVNLNTATGAELQQVPGIGPATADKILKMRKSYGPFKSVDDLRAIKGIGPKRMEKMRKYITVGRTPAPPKATSSAATSSISKTQPHAPPKASNQNPAAKPPGNF